LIEVILKIL